MLTVKFDFDSDKVRVKLEGLTGLENVDNMTLKEVLNQHLMIETPAKTFARKIKSINLDSVSEVDIEDDIEAEAAVSNRLSELWKNDIFNENEEIENSKMNVLMLFCHALEIIANQS